MGLGTEDRRGTCFVCERVGVSVNRGRDGGPGVLGGSYVGVRCGGWGGLPVEGGGDAKALHRWGSGARTGGGLCEKTREREREQGRRRNTGSVARGRVPCLFLFPVSTGVGLQPLLSASCIPDGSPSCRALQGLCSTHVSPMGALLAVLLCKVSALLIYVHGWHLCMHCVASLPSHRSSSLHATMQLPPSSI